MVIHRHRRGVRAAVIAADNMAFRSGFESSTERDRSNVCLVSFRPGIAFVVVGEKVVFLIVGGSKAPEWVGCGWGKGFIVIGWFFASGLHDVFGDFGGWEG